MALPYPLLQSTALFSGLTRPQLELLLPALGCTTRHYAKGETLLMAGYSTHHIGVVTRGHIRAVKETRAGQPFTVALMGPGGVFGDVLSGGHNRSPVSVIAESPCTVLLLDSHKLLQPQPTADIARQRLLANLVSVLSGKYFALDKRIDLLLVHGIRKRLAGYLLEQARQQGNPFTIPFSRTALAAYLGCDRSALSRELSGLVHGGLVQTKGKWFLLLQPQQLQQLL